MTIAELCLPAMILLIIASIVPAKLNGAKEYDNANPRDPRFYTPGIRAWSQGAHINGYESFPFFAASVLLAEMHGANQQAIDAVAVVFVLVRAAYVMFYLTGRPNLRSIAWFVGLGCNLAIFLVPVWAAP